MQEKIYKENDLSSIGGVMTGFSGSKCYICSIELISIDKVIGVGMCFLAHADCYLEQKYKEIKKT